MSPLHRNPWFAIPCIAVLCTFCFVGWPATTRAQPSTGPAISSKLDPDRQKKIWDLEHMSFVIEAYFGKPFVDALKSADRERLLASLHEDFVGRLATSYTRVPRRAGSVTELKQTPAASRNVDAAAYVDHLIGSLAAITTFERAKLKVLFIDSPEGESGRWNATLMLIAAGTDSDGLSVEHVSIHEAEFRAPDDESFKQGSAVVAGLGIVNEIERKSPERLMEEVTEQVGFSDLPLPDNWLLPTRLVRGHRYQFAVEDYDRDGYPDIAIAATNGRPLLLRNVHGERFEDTTESVGLEPTKDSPRENNQNALLAWIDYDNDGFADLLMGTRLYHNVKGERFEDATDGSGLTFDRSPFGAAVADYDADGRLDLYVVNQKGFRRRPPGQRPWVGDPYAGTENHLWHNEGGGRFKSVTVAANAGGGWHQTFAAASLHFDDDAFPDLYLANDFGTNVLLRNRGDGTFEDITARSGTGDFSTSMGVAAGDLDNDGSPELYISNMYSKMGRRIVAHIRESDYPDGLYEKILGSLAGNRLYRVGPDGVRFTEHSEDLGINQVGWAFAPAMVDLDGDGWLDLYATAGYNSADPNKPDG